MNEEAVLIEGSTPLVAVVTLPEACDFDPRRPACVLLNAGLSHRVGPARISVNLARSLAARGFASIRFDASGVGDSPARADNLPVDQSGVLETREVMDFLARTRRVEGFYLMGLCSGAIFSFRTALQDPRVRGIGLLNLRSFDRNESWQQSVESRNWMRGYLARLARPEAWGRLLRGRTDFRHVARTLRLRAISLTRARGELGRVAGELAADVQRLIERRVAILWVSSDEDPSVDYFVEFQRRAGSAFSAAAIERVIIAGANHTFTQQAHQAQVASHVGAWVARCAA